MENISEIFIIFLISILCAAGLFIGYIIKHEHNRKKEIRNVKNNTE